MKRKTSIAVGLTVASGIIFAPLAAAASTPWPGNIVVGDYLWYITEGLDSYGSTDAADSIGSMLYKTGLLELDDNDDPSDGTLSSDSMCTDPIEAPGGVSLDGDDTVITCAPYTVAVGDPGAGLTVDIEFRTLAATNAARLLYALSNETSADILVPAIYVRSSWENSTYCGSTSSGIVGACDGSDNMAIGTSDRWMVTTDDENDIPSASVWASCQAAVVTQKDDYNSYYASTGEEVTIPAGETLYYVAFLAMQTPEIPQDLTSTQQALDALAERVDDDFAYLSDSLRVGIPDGANIALWEDSCGPQPEPTPDVLPNTGTGQAGIVGLIGAGGALVLVSGVTVMWMRRRHN